MTKICKPGPRRIVIFVYEGAQPIDVSGPLQTFDTASEEAMGNCYRCSIVSVGGSPIRLQSGMTVLTEPLPKGARFDTLVIPGGPGVHAARKSPEIVLQVKKLAERAERVCSVCTGAFLLAQAGLLEGRNAATHWRACAELSREFPGVQVQPDPIWVRDDRIWTSAGVTAGIDLALAMVEADLGSALATRTARRLVVYMRRSGGQAQFSTPLALQTADSFGPLFDWINKNLHKSLKVTDLADEAGMSPRTFIRHFTEKMGMTPGKALEGLRLERAQSLLTATTLSLSEVARRTGFGREERLRNAFVRNFAIGPTQWRYRFNEKI
ncbi:GlxA family transcriptional regulator [Paraburkholderia fynbosensis]|uniref:HTH-type transcriptional regulator CdhR n=1 Tax=Paraburkholderia fynbosensis TaxID=1200993 RepID=A0A6J5H202_9BURK|nr:GlxA family transcriptional regulator [Paraburkholderia fynbosensis]CAB3809825.1 HTH-type transcriptional regulator CdhR [Paraburkholderia fynbosensis]